MNDPIEIARFFDVRQAEFAASVLAGDGIETFLDQPFTGSIAPHYAIGSGGIRLFASAEDSERASEVLQSFAAAEEHSSDEESE